ncbi:hypothetical protein Tco_0515379 [Tanacetum coccineum]
MMIVKYCPRGEIKKLEIELWNLKVKGTDVASYTLRFQELALMCGRMFQEESDEVEKYPVAPPSPDYVPGPEHSPSPDYVPGSEHPPSPVEVPYVPEPEYPEYLVPSDVEAPLEDQPLPTDALPTALSPGYVADFDPEEDLEEDHLDYPADGGDGDDEQSDDDNDDDTDDED